MRYLLNFCLLSVTLVCMKPDVSAQSISPAATEDRIIKHAFDADQHIRQTLDSLQNANCPTEQLIPFYQEMARKDLENQRIVLPILDDYLADKNRLSEESLQYLFYIIQHADEEVQMKYRHFIGNLFEKGILSNIEYAMFVDRLSVRQNKAQQFGFQCHMNAYTRDRFCYPVSDDMEKRRAEIGLEDLEFDESSSDYPLIDVSPTEYVIFGHALRKEGQTENFVGVFAEVSVGQHCVSTNDIGFFAIKLNKRDVPEALTFLIDGKRYSLPIRKKTDTDWEIIDLMLTQ